MKAIFFKLVWYALKNYGWLVYNWVTQDDRATGRGRCPECGSIKDFDTYYGGTGNWQKCKRCGFSREE